MPKTIEVFRDRTQPSIPLAAIRDNVKVSSVVSEAVTALGLPAGDWGLLDDRGVILGENRTVADALIDGARYTLVQRS